MQNPWRLSGVFRFSWFAFFRWRLKEEKSKAFLEPRVQRTIGLGFDGFIRWSCGEFCLQKDINTVTAMVDANSFASPWLFFMISYFLVVLVMIWELSMCFGLVCSFPLADWSLGEKNILKSFVGFRVWWSYSIEGFGGLSLKKDAIGQMPLSLGHLINNCILLVRWTMWVEAARRVNHWLWVWLINLDRGSVRFLRRKILSWLNAVVSWSFC